MQIVVIGGVAAGTKTAAKLMRRERSAEVTVYTKSKEISYAGCGLPYYVGGSIESPEELIVNTPARYTALTGVKVETEMEAVSVDPAAKTVTFANGRVVSYDKLVIATGAVPYIPDAAGTDLPGVFTMRTPDDAIAIREYIEKEFSYNLNFTCDEIRPTYYFNETCMDTVPQAIVAFLDGESFEDVIRTGVSIVGDTDTLCAIAGSIAEAYYGIPEDIGETAKSFLTYDLLKVVEKFYNMLQKSQY